jgi:prevent-host-death family protein
MKGHYSPARYRIRTGDYRIIYNIDDARVTVLVLRASNRRSIYEWRLQQARSTTMNVDPKVFEGYEQVSVTDARAILSDVVDKIAFHGERVVLTRQGKPVAILVPTGDLAELADIDAQDMAAVREALDEESTPAPHVKRTPIR